MGKPRDERQKDLFRFPLEAIIDLGHPLVRLAGEIDWDFLDGRFGSVCRAGPGQPPLPSRLVAGLLIVKHLHDLSDEALCARWIENPYYQYFRGEQTFRHDLPFDRSSLTRWRQRLGEEQLQALLQESLKVAHPTDARLMHRALEKLVKLARREGVGLRQSYARVAKRAAIMIGRYIHAHQFKRARRALRFLRARLGRVIRDIRRKTEGNATLEARFRSLLDLAVKVRLQDQHQRGQKSLPSDLIRGSIPYTRQRSSASAPSTGSGGKARAPYEFGCKVSIATPVTKPRGGQFALHGNPFDGHTLGPVVAEMIRLIGVEPRRIHVDKGYRGHNHPNKFRVWISGQVRRVTKAIRREMRRRAAVEPVIGHVKAEHRMDRNYLKGRPGDRANAVLAAAGYNFSLLLRWLGRLLRAVFQALIERPPAPQPI
jgi:IS5 family transposase